ncbi:MAG: response regulator, partial [Rhodomicrobium sp.]|nr:response regulator [Rhodomicrobium sp.]
TPIVGTLDLLQRRFQCDERAQRLISGAQQSADRACVLVQRLLAFARRQHLETRAVGIRELVAGMTDLIGRSLGPQIEIQVELEEGLPPVKADPNQLELALLNLAVNSRDAMPGGGTLSFAAKAVSLAAASSGLAPGRYVCLAVRDTGEGMTPETLARAVEPFYSTKAAGKGTGLGLSMVHGLAAQSGGQLTLESTLGAGTTATLWLPVATARSLESPPVLGGRPQMRQLSILLAEDQDLVRASTAALLESMGHAVLQAASGEAALDHLASGTVCDLLITDYMMPGMSGAELAIKARELRPRLPAILITGYANLEEAGTDSFLRLSKPFQSADLARAVSDAALNGPGAMAL